MMMNQNTATAIYQTKVAGHCRLVSVTWSKGATIGHCLHVSMDSPSFHCMCRVKMKPAWGFWSTKQGVKRFNTEDGQRVQIHWDLTAATYDTGPEPRGGYYIAMVYEKEIVLLVGDMRKEALQKIKGAAPSAIEATLVSRREYLLGKKVFSTRAQIGDGGRMHEVRIEFQSAANGEPWLCVRVDSEAVVKVRELRWKFRGNQTIQLVDGSKVEVFWDVHDWLFKCSAEAHAIFMFQRCVSGEKPWLSDITACKSITEWKAPCSSSKIGPSVGFALFLFAGKTP